MCFLILNILLFISKYNILIPPLNALDGGGLRVVIIEEIGAVLIAAVVGDVIVIGGGLPVRIIPKILF